MQSITVCVDYDDFLRVTLPINLRHFESTLVVTATHDKATQALAASCGCRCLVTDAFYRGGASFNKGAAMEEGFNLLGDCGWLCVWDSDIIMPDSLHIPDKRWDCLYTPIRRVLASPRSYRYDIDWSALPSPTCAREFDGYFQLFNTAVNIPKPWYGINWTHAGGCDSDFTNKFPPDKRLRPPFEVLHLGEEGSEARVGKNWAGRVTPRLDSGYVGEFARARNEHVQKIIKARLAGKIAAEEKIS